MKREFVDPLDSLRSQWRNAKESLGSENARLDNLENRHRQMMAALQDRQEGLAKQSEELKLDEDAVNRFRKDLRFLPEWGFFDREDLARLRFIAPGLLATLPRQPKRATNNVPRSSEGGKKARAHS